MLAGKDVTESCKREVLKLFEEYSDTWVRTGGLPPRSRRLEVRSGGESDL